MDPICHTLVGGALAQTELGRKSALATAALVIGANLPDVDGVAILMGSDTSLFLRRGWTHGLPAVLLLPLLLTGGLLLWHRLFGAGRGAPPLRPAALLGLSYLAVATHPSLDWMNNYGMRWLMPFDGTWFYGDTLFIVDPWIWLALGGAVFLYRSRRLSSLLGWALFAAAAGTLLFSLSGLVPAKGLWLAAIAALAVLRVSHVGREEASARRIATGAVAAVTLYIGAMSLMARYARAEVLDLLDSRGIVIEKLMVSPVPVTPFRKDVVLRTPEGYRYGSANLLPPFDVDLAPRPLPLVKDSPLARRALASPSVRGFANWARFPYGEVEATDGGWVVYLMDARYNRERSTDFGAARVVLSKAAETNGP